MIVDLRINSEIDIDSMCNNCSENVCSICPENVCTICSDNVRTICSENVCTICSENVCSICSENGCSICPNNVCTLCSQNVCTICSENVCSTCSADYCKFLFTCSLLLLVNCLLPQLNVCSGKSKVGILGKCFKRYYNSIKQKPPISHPDWDSVNMTVNFRAPFYSKAAGNGKGIYNSILIRWFVDLSR